jgi:hypothetical protein
MSWSLRDRTGELRPNGDSHQAQLRILQWRFSLLLPPPQSRNRILSDTKSFTLALKHQPVTRDQSNVQKTPVSFKSLTRNTFDQRMLFEQGIPNGREVIPLAHRVRAQARKVGPSLLRHCKNKHPDFGRVFDLDQCNWQGLGRFI